MRIFLLSIITLLILTCDDKDDPYYGYRGTFNPPTIELRPSPIIKIENELLEYDLPLIIVPIDYNRSSAEINLGITIKWKILSLFLGGMPGTPQSIPFIYSKVCSEIIFAG